MILRVYEPSKCDEAGIPLDWERCRTCKGTKREWHEPSPFPSPCYPCDGHGSLKAAALASIVDGQMEPRCEDCQHPTSEGTWEGGAEWVTPGRAVAVAHNALVQGNEPPMTRTHYSRCDEQCDHLGGFRWQPLDRAGLGDECGWNSIKEFDIDALPDFDHKKWRWEASWRPVDVRCLSWAHDLRPESLACLCLRCWANRTKEAL